MRHASRLENLLGCTLTAQYTNMILYDLFVSIVATARFVLLLFSMYLTWREVCAYQADSNMGSDQAFLRGKLLQTWGQNYLYAPLLKHEYIHRCVTVLPILPKE